MLSAIALLAMAPQTSGLSQPSSPPSSDDDIVVEGIRVPGEEGIDIGTRDLSTLDPRQSVVANRIRYQFSSRIAACAVRGALSSPVQLRAVVDGAFNLADQRLAQDLLVRRNATCSESAQLLSFGAGSLGESIYDRGAFLIAALRTYAPDLKLTRKDTGSAVVQSRFNRREVPRNRYRLPVDYRYFEVAVCMVRLQPTLSVRLALNEDQPRELGRIENAIVSGARICVGNARKVAFDPTQFRLYIADAVYRWAVAARGVDSLIPTG